MNADPTPPGNPEISAPREAFTGLPGPVLVLSSRAGNGNFSVGEALAEQLAALGLAATHAPLETLLAEPLCAKHFGRYRRICRSAPWLLFLIYGVPLGYLSTWLRERAAPNPLLTPLGAELAARGAGTIICTNHRACFFVAALKRRKLLTCTLAAVITDFHVNAGWRLLFWKEVDRVLGPLPAAEIPTPLRRGYQQIEMPLRAAVAALDPAESDLHQVLISGGGWGLGPLEQTAAALLRRFPELTVHLLCGDDAGLFSRMARHAAAHPALRLYRLEDDAAPALARSASVITKPGAVTLCEAARLAKKIFLLPGLPVTERANARYARIHFGAEDFSLGAFQTWHQEALKR